LRLPDPHAVSSVYNRRAMDRRRFLETLRNGVSGSFALGSVGGAAVAGGGVALYDSGEGGRRSFAQQGEDLVVQNLLDVIGLQKPTYLDVGAYDPTIHSNTYLMYLEGGHGVLVEPNPAKIGRLERVRPRDRTLNMGIGMKAERYTADYYVIGGPSKGLFNTFSKADAELVQSNTHGLHFIERVIPMPLENINTIMQQHFDGAPNFLSIDTEGMDLDILKTMDFDRYRPDVVCVETLEIGTDHVEMDTVRFMAGKRYSVRGATFVNTIFIDDRHLTEPGPLVAPPHAAPA
jgi:FkbM family methyltransferase